MSTILQLFAFTALVQCNCALTNKETLVYPRILESREYNGERTLKINEEITLNLQKTSVFSEKLLIRTYRGGSLVSQYVDGFESNKHLYHDTEKMAALIVKDSDELSVEGLVRHDLRIKPMPHLERSSEGHVAHILTPVKQRMPYQGDHGHPLNEPEKPFGENSTINIVERKNAQVISPEVHFVLDAATCSAYNYDIKEITNYLSVLVAAANLRYRSVTYPNVNISVVAVTLLKENTQPFMRFYKGNKNMVTFHDTLMAFNQHFLKDPEFNQADVYFLLTGLDIVGVANDGSAMTLFSGYAYLSKVCTEFKVGMSEDEPKSYDGVHLFSHELAHLLGCAHDQDPPDGTMPGHPGSLNCPWDDGYMMSYVINFKNHFKFSKCCVASIRFVSQQRGCLYETNAKNPVRTLSSLPGFRITATEFCKFMHPLYRGVRSDEKAGLSNCVQTCRTARNRRGGYYKWIHAALDGVPCDKRNTAKVCINGICTPFPQKNNPHRRT